MITTALVLAVPDLEASYFAVMHASGSGFGIGAVLLQADLSKFKHPKGPRAFHSAYLSSAEHNYPVESNNCLQGRCYFEGAKETLHINRENV